MILVARVQAAARARAPATDPVPTRPAKGLSGRTPSVEASPVRATPSAAAPRAVQYDECGCLGLAVRLLLWATRNSH
jgi:hypothetical protein